jgi:hypothetical protein
MSNNFVLLNTAYFPPVSYFSFIAAAGSVLIEREENYLKQTFRNRCDIYSANGQMSLIVPVLRGSFHKTPVKDIRIDYSKRWQQVHLGALVSSYRSSPFFEYFYNSVEKIISNRFTFLLDLNLASLEMAMEASGILKPVGYTSEFRTFTNEIWDKRDYVSPKKDPGNFFSPLKKYNQVFEDRYGFISGLSILDLIFNTGPDAKFYLEFNPQGS